MLITLASLLVSWGVEAQQKANREIEVHKNVRLIMNAIPPDTPEEVVNHYNNFLPLLEEVVKENTKDESAECALTIRVTVGHREIGSAKVMRATARITGFRRGSSREYLGDFILHSYINDGPVNKEETTQFLLRQILEPAECQAENTEES